jgi:hypothetical protein
MMQTDKTKDVFYLYIIATLILTLLFSCNPVKQVLDDPKKLEEVWEKGALQGRCVNDSVFTNTSDTLINFDTLYALDMQVDTIFLNDVQTIVKKEIKTVVKTVTIRDTLKTVIVDNSRVALLDNIVKKQDGTIEDLTNDLRLTKAQRNKWSFRFFALLGIIVIVLFRKPILTFLSGGWNKVLKMFT